MQDKNYHQDYKTIRSECKQIDEMLNAAENLEVDLDHALLKDVYAFKERILSERNIRKSHELFSGSITSRDQAIVGQLENVIDIAKQNQVDREYIELAEKLAAQMKGHIEAHDVLELLQEYPDRKYPVIKDANEAPTKSFLIRAAPKAPSSSQGKKAAAPKKPVAKKPKEPAFEPPAWAEDLQAVEEKVRQMQLLANDGAFLQLGDEFMEEANKQMARFNKEIEFRKQEAEKARLAAEMKAMKKTRGSSRAASSNRGNGGLSSRGNSVQASAGRNVRG